MASGGLRRLGIVLLLLLSGWSGVGQAIVLLLLLRLLLTKRRVRWEVYTRVLADIATAAYQCSMSGCSASAKRTYIVGPSRWWGSVLLAECSIQNARESL